MTKRVNKKKTVRQPKPIKIAALIVSAIQDLKETKGSTPKKIAGYITYASQLPSGKVKRQVNAALKRGVQYGILRRYRGHYFLPSGDELERANKIADRFARLPSPEPNELIPDISYPAPIKEQSTKTRRKRLGRGKKLQTPRRRNTKNKRQQKFLSLPMYMTPSENNRLKNVDDELSIDSSSN